MLSLTLSGLSLPTLQLPLKGLSTTFGSAPASQKLFGLNAGGVTFGWRVASARHDDRLARERPRWIRGKCAPKRLRGERARKRLRGERARKPRAQHHHVLDGHVDGVM